MVNTFLGKNIEYLIELFKDSKEGLIIVDNQKNISYVNDFALELFGLSINIENISLIEHYFSFDVCILKEEDIATYNPVTAAIESVENFKAEVFFQVAQNQYKSLIIRSFNLNNSKIMLFFDLSAGFENVELKKKQIEYSDKINELEKYNNEYSTLKERAESQAIRVGLINKISTSIRDTLDINEIVKSTIDEISKTLGVYRGIFARFDKTINQFEIKQEWNINNSSELTDKIIDPQKDMFIKEMLLNNTYQLSTDIDESSKIARARFILPIVYQGEMLGMMMFYHQINRSWHPEEISLIEGISAQVAAVIYQALLFKKLENQNNELELTLKQLKDAQSQLIQSEKMASLGKLVAGVAHEINTPVGSLNSNIDMLVKCTKKLKDQFENVEKVGSTFEVLEEINVVNGEAIKRINTIIKSLRNFARLDEAELKEVDIHEGIKSSLMLINHEIKNRIEIIEEYSDLPMVECYPNQLNQVIMNILVNAYQSIEDQGTIKIKTETDSNAVRIIISDTGKGISSENIDKIFDPGFTTKGVGVGTGLGLSICYQIVEKHHGIIKVDSQVGVGTVFMIEIPVRQER